MGIHTCTSKYPVYCLLTVGDWHILYVFTHTYAHTLVTKAPLMRISVLIGCSAPELWHSTSSSVGVTCMADTWREGGREGGRKEGGREGGGREGGREERGREGGREGEKGREGGREKRRREGGREEGKGEGGREGGREADGRSML